MKVGFSMVFIGGAKWPPPGPDVKSKYPGPDRVKPGLSSTVLGEWGCYPFEVQAGRLAYRENRVY